ncbi:GL12161 [Drosophila persimilis]|uniref:GL12161 n=1 Tax=Drosophila persimilis TaxID=7234 RepID=B4GMU9_DROPE|nr:GL12161 [Drosophila persimilis]
MAQQKQQLLEQGQEQPAALRRAGIQKTQQKKQQQTTQPSEAYVKCFPSSSSSSIRSRGKDTCLIIPVQARLSTCTPEAQTAATARHNAWNK